MLAFRCSDLCQHDFLIFVQVLSPSALRIASRTLLRSKVTLLLTGSNENCIFLCAFFRNSDDMSVPKVLIGFRCLIRMAVKAFRRRLDPPKRTSLRKLGWNDIATPRCQMREWRKQGAHHAFITYRFYQDQS